jgi:predicted SAM-dependent methyltransferase
VLTEDQTKNLFETTLDQMILLNVLRRLGGRSMPGANPIESHPLSDPVATEPLNLHIGGLVAKPGWKILNAQPGEAVDLVGDVRDLGSFPEASCQRIYASHVLEHVDQNDFLPTLKGINRVLRPGGDLYVSVPDLDVLSRMFLDRTLTLEQRFHVMRMMFGGQMDQHDFHYIGLNEEILTGFLLQAGFSSIRRVDSFGLFSDTSDFRPYGVAISLNLIASKS